MADHVIDIISLGLKVKVVANSNLFGVLAENGIFLRSDCGGKGKCNQCTVKLINSDETRAESPACQVSIDCDLRVEIPSASLQSPRVISKSPVKLPASFCDSFVKSDEVIPAYGIGVDLGTTTIALYLCQMNEGKILSSLTVKNPQAIYGDDVMSRIGEAAAKKESLVRLHTLAIKAVEWGCRELIAQAFLLPDKIEKITVVGNPAMMHLFLGVSPETLGVAPYQPAFFENQHLEAKKLGFKDITASIHTLPQISGFVGGDILAAALAAELEECPTGTLLIDIGTNGELIFKGKGGLYATSCATGPVFEGAAISCGMQALPGAIDSVSISDPLLSPRFTMIEVNGNNPCSPAGICGSGVISGVAELYRRGIIDKTGAFIEDHTIASLAENSAGGSHYVIARQHPRKRSRDIVLSQRDIRAVQLGKAALITGIELLMQLEKSTSLERIILTGTFGSYLNKEDLKDLGIIPHLANNRIQVSGNLAGTGAVMALCSKLCFDTVCEIAGKISVVDLVASPEFQERFIANLHFPDSPDRQ